MLRRRRELLIIFFLVGLVMLLFRLLRNKGSSLSKLKDDIEPAHPPCSSIKACPKLLEITCDINQDVAANVGLQNLSSAQPYVDRIPCRLDYSTREVYVPFTFLKSYYEVSGDFGRSGQDRFSWSHSYSRIFPHLYAKPYGVSGPFLQFSNFAVENRRRVKLVSAKYGIPISTQWDKNGHYYPTQVCQYALAHWSKFKVKIGEQKKDLILEDGGPNEADWQINNGRGEVIRVVSDSCVHFDESMHLETHQNMSASNFVLGFDLKLEEDVTVTLHLKIGKSGMRFSISYVPKEDMFIWKKGSTIVIGYGVLEQRGEKVDGTKTYENDWMRFTRNIANDLAKGLGKTYQMLMDQWEWIVLEKVSFRGVGCVTNLTLFQSPTSHLRMFFHAADWLVRSQDVRTGGWPVSVVFNEGKLKYPRAKEIPPGWNSAMGQGHAMSVLTRAFSFTKDGKYLDAASKALNLFNYPTVNSENGSQNGVTSKFMDRYVWYEEYPTEPSSFVLNGFMYSLLGLYDFWQTATEKKEEAHHAKTLFREGFTSLKAMLPFFDTGSGSVYDLRHFTMPGASPKLARWDYHSLHVNLLFALSTIDVTLSGVEPDENFLLNTAKRWQGYMYGRRADHN